MNTDTATSSKPHILLVEDDELTRKIEAFTFKELGCEVVTAPNVESALSALKDPYDLIVLDIGLPDQSGISLADNIRRGRTPQPYSTPIVIVSTFTTDVDRQKYLNVGVTEVFPKPLDHEKIKCLLIKLISKK